jgi:hypothetical protein
VRGTTNSDGTVTASNVLQGVAGFGGGGRFGGRGGNGNGSQGNNPQSDNNTQPAPESTTQ